MKELLDSDRVNFLVWRFLLESNYRETAAKFQKEWQIQAPHRHFDFAAHVKNYALVSILNKGLVYEALEREFMQSQQVPHDVPAATLEAARVGVFGPFVAQPPHEDEEEDGEGEADAEAEVEAEEVEMSRKRQMDGQHHALPNGSPAKRPRLSHGYEQGADSATTPMEIDHAETQQTNSNGNNNNHAYPSPLEGEHAPSPAPRTDGPEQGTQVDKVHELSPETIFLRLAADESAAPDSQNPIVLHCEWNPRDPSVLAAAGTDALARVWTVSRSSTDLDDSPDHVNRIHRPFEDLVDDDLPRSSTVTAMAWNGEGTALAIATEVGNKARISVWGHDGSANYRFDGAESPVIKLRWSPNNSLILAIAPENGGTLVTLFSSVTANSSSYVLPVHDLRDDPLDATWISESEFILCGGDLLVSLRFAEGHGIAPNRRFDTRKDEGFSQVQFDWRSGLLATASDKGTVDLWDEHGKRRSINAHMGVVTSLQWQPLQSAPQNDERLLASGGEDGAIFIWNVRSPENRPKYSMPMEDPVVALSFTPDGAFISGATSGRILIWKVGDHQIPRASWNRAPHPGWLSPRAGSDQEEEDTHCLCWDASGQKLAYGVNSRLAVINFR